MTHQQGDQRQAAPTGRHHQRMNQLSKRIALITNATSSIKRTVTTHFLNKNTSVCKFDLHPKPIPKDALTVTGNMHSNTDLAQTINTAITTFKQLDVLITNTKIHNNSTTLNDITTKTLKQLLNKVLTINIKNYLLTMHTTHEPLAQTHSTMIATTSINNKHPKFNKTAYITSKHTVTGLVHQLT